MNLADHRNLFRGDDAIVLAPGPSFVRAVAKGLRVPSSTWTIGCNRACLKFRPEFLVCVEPAGDPIWREINDHPLPTTTLATLPELARTGADLVLPTIHPRDWPGWECDVHAGATPSSAWIAAALAGYMGARRVGVLGVDLVGHPILGEADEIARQNERWAALAFELAAEHDCEVVNLSWEGALEVLPRAKLQEFVA
jgi:hypothetical protein